MNVIQVFFVTGLLIWLIVDNVKFYNWYKKEKIKLKNWFPKSTSEKSFKIKVRSTNKYDYLVLPIWGVVGWFMWSGENVPVLVYIIFGSYAIFSYYKITEPFALAHSNPFIELTQASNVTISYAFLSYGLGALFQGFF